MNPFTQTTAGSAGEWGEIRLIDAIREWLGDASPPAPFGIGDDCAVFNVTPGAQGLVTTDPVLWGRHFDESVGPEEAAEKLFRRNLSDIAAMGGRPTAAVVSLLLPTTTSLEWLKHFYLGLAKTSRRYQVPVAGGDVSQTDGLLGACMTLLGETTCGRSLTRNGASAGDHLLVTGSLGGSRLGRHCKFEPRLQEGQWLAGRPEVVAAMDISDGLAKDLLSLIPTGCAAELSPEAIPVHRDAMAIAATTKRPPLFHALCDGEDHELLFAVEKNTALDEFQRDWEARFGIGLSRIGRIGLYDENGPVLRGLPPELADGLQGYEHLR